MHAAHITSSISKSVSLLVYLHRLRALLGLLQTMTKLRCHWLIDRFCRTCITAAIVNNALQTQTHTQPAT